MTVNEMPNHNHTNGSFQNVLQVTGCGTVSSTDCDATQPDLTTFAQMQSQGNGAAHENRPAYYGVIWVMRVK